MCHGFNTDMLVKTAKLVELSIIRFWWVILFCLLCSIFYEQGYNRIEADYTKLNEQLKKLEGEKEKALALQENLLMQLESQSDPAWVEMLLMKGLGVVPEGQKKVFFKK